MILNEYPNMSANFNGFFDDINNNSIIAYQKFLIDNMFAAFEVVFRNLNTQSFTAISNYCHDNVEDYCIINPNCKKIEGWLCIAYPDSPFTTIASHSIVLLENRNRKIFYKAQENNLI